jgi:YVTN family beta-propeller protein
MTRRDYFWITIAASGLTGCSGGAPSPEKKEEARKPTGAYRIYVTNEASGDLTVIDSANHDVIATVKLGKRPRGIRSSPDGKTIYVALSGSPFAPPGVDESTLPPPDRSADGIGVVDAVENKLVKIIRAGQDPESFDVTTDGHTLYVSNEDDEKTSIVDLGTGEVRAAVAVGEEPEGVTLTPDGKFCYVTSEGAHAIYVIDTAARKLAKKVRIGKRPRAVVFRKDGAKGYVSQENEGAVAVIDARKHVLVKQIKLEGQGVKPMGLVLSNDESRLYVSTGRFHKVFVIDTATEAAIDSFDAGERPWGIGISPDGKLLYTANGPAGDVSVIDLATKAVVKRVKAQDRPWGILVLPTPKAG